MPAERALRPVGRRSCMRRRVEPELARAAEQAFAVERHRRRRLIRAREEIRPDVLRRVVPDLGAVQRQHDRLAGAAARAAQPSSASRPLLWTWTTSAASMRGLRARDGSRRAARRRRGAASGEERHRSAAEPMSPVRVARRLPRHAAGARRTRRCRRASAAHDPSCHGSSALAA